MRTVLLTLLVLPGVGEAATLSVGPGGYATIGEALLAAYDGDTIEVEAGDYPETLVIGVDVDIVGLGGLGGTSLSGSGAPSVEIQGATVSLTGFTLEPTADRGIVVASGSVFTGSDLDISGFSVSGYDSGAGLAADGAEVYLTDVLFDSNSADVDGGAVALNASLAVLTRVTVTQTFTGADGGVSADFSDVFIHESTFEDNVSDDDGAAISLENDSSGVVTDTTFVGNTASDDGGAVNAEAGVPLLVEGCTFEANLADMVSGTGLGGALRVRYGTDATVRDSTFTSNASDSEGGAVHLISGAHLFEDNVFVSNSTDTLGGAVYVEGSASLESDGEAFEGNTASYGGALYVRDEAAVDIRFASFSGNEADSDRGGAIRANQEGVGELTVSFSAFDANLAGSTGGAISVATGFGTPGAFTAIDNAFTANTASEAGGALYLDSVELVYLEANRFCVNDGGLEGGGAAVIDSGRDTHAWFGNLFVENASSDEGGALYFETSTTPEVINNTFVGNGSVDGGHLRAASTTADLVNNIFSEAVSGRGVTQSIAGGTRDYNLWFGNQASDVGGALDALDLGAGAVFDDPDFVAYSADGDCTNDDLSLDGASPAVDAGDPALSDRDGSPSDIGAYGGPSGIPLDTDGDGYNTLQDCDDGDAAVNPGASEICDGIDNDCDGNADGAEAVGALDWYLDTDGDGYGGDAGLVVACYDPGGYVNTGGDCDDGDPDISPVATEICDDLDQNCNGIVDEGVRSAWYQDLDGDGFGGGDIQLWACEGLDDLVAEAGDCDDDDVDIHPEAVEVCDDIDNNCDGDVDEGLSRLWYLDADGDGYGTWEEVAEACGILEGFSLDAGDCDDSDPAIHPGANDTRGDDLDQDCDGVADGAGAAKSEGGCGCDIAGGSRGGWVFVVALSVLIRRRRTRS
jgi:predicted outer membrane repeat protein